MAGYPSYPLITTFQMCHDRLVCCKWVLLIYPAGRLWVFFNVAVTTAESFLSGLSRTERVEKMDFDYFQIWKKKKLFQIQKSSLNEAVKKEVFVRRSPDERRWCCQTAHKGTNSALSSLCCPRSVSLKEKSNLKHPISDFKKAGWVILVPIFLLFP